MSSVTRRQFVQLSGLIGAGLGLTACSVSGGVEAGSEKVRVGVMGPYSGAVAQYGLACRNGSLLCMKQFNEKGGYKGQAVELIVQDEKGDSTEAVNVYNKMVDDGVSVVIGDVTSKPTVAVAQVSVNDNMPCVTPSATTADVIAFGKNFFRATVTDPFQGKVMAGFAHRQGYKTLATIYNNQGDYEAGVEKAFVEQAQALGLTVASRQGYPEGAVDFNAQLTAILATNPDAIFAPNYYADSGKIVTQARQLGYKGIFLGSDGWANIVGGDQDYASPKDLEGCFYNAAFLVENNDPKVANFVEAYKKEYGEVPSNFCALGYDAALIVCDALQKVESKNLTPGSAEFKQAVIDAIAENKVDGVTGTISFKGTGDPVKATLIISFENGKEKIFDTYEA